MYKEKSQKDQFLKVTISLSEHKGISHTSSDRIIYLKKKKQQQKKQVCTNSSICQIMVVNKVPHLFQIQNLLNKRVA